MKKFISTALILFIFFLPLKADNISAMITHAIDGTATGKIELTIIGGQAPYSILWSGPYGYSSTDAAIYNLLPGIYQVEIKDAYCGIVNIEYEIESRPYSNDDIETPIFKIFPNPTNNTVHVHFIQEAIHIAEIFNLKGQIVKSEVLTLLENNIDINHLIPGVYIIKITNGNNSYQHKIIKLP